MVLQIYKSKVDRKIQKTNYEKLLFDSGTIVQNLKDNNLASKKKKPDGIL